jgi:hypothetical protein
MSPKLIATTSIWVNQSAKYDGLGLLQAAHHRCSELAMKVMNPVNFVLEASSDDPSQE